MVKPSYQTGSLCTYQKDYQQGFCYLIWLDQLSLSPSAACTVANTVWEDDFKALELEEVS